MFENLLVVVTLFTHDGGTYLAEAYAVTPTVSVQDEATRYATTNILRFDTEFGIVRLVR